MKPEGLQERSVSAPHAPDELPAPDSDHAILLADVALGLGVAATRLAARSAQFGLRLLSPAAPVVQSVLRPLSLADEHWPAHVLRNAAGRGQQQRVDAVSAATEAVRALVPAVLDAVLDEIDLTRLVIERVDLDAVVAAVDVNAVVARADVDAVIDRVDLIALAQYVIDGVNLPQIIRDSTGSMASEGIRGMRLQTIDADERVNRLVDRMLLRRNGRRTDAVEMTSHHQPSGGREAP